MNLCASCNRRISQEGRAVKFPCPSCGEELWRCEKCRRLSNPYRCTKCGFAGP